MRKSLSSEAKCDSRKQRPASCGVVERDRGGEERGAGVELRHGARVVRLEPRPGGGFRLGIQRMRDSAAFDYGR